MAVESSDLCAIFDFKFACHEISHRRDFSRAQNKVLTPVHEPQLARQSDDAGLHVFFFPLTSHFVSSPPTKLPKLSRLFQGPSSNISNHSMVESEDGQQ
jgi:hypothetical protein